MIHVTIIPILKDNYAYLLRADNGASAVIDPGDAPPILDVLRRENIDLTYVINTHHHWDHTDGNVDIVAAYPNAKLVAPRAELAQISDVDIPLSEGDSFEFGGENMKIIATPGHTMGHLCFYFAGSKLLFTGDTVFLMGCGRLFEGSPADMHKSFNKIKALPDDVHVYCGHEYTLLGAKFGMKYAPENTDIAARYEKIKKLRAKKYPTIPALLGEEKKTNLFMVADTADAFADLRAKRDNFKI